MSDKFYANDTPAQLLARITNYEEGIGEVLTVLRSMESPNAQEGAAMLAALMQATGNDHLMALRQFEESTAAIDAFKNRVLEALCKDGCPTCGGLNTHAPDCLVATALRVKPHGLPEVKEHLLVTLGHLHARIARVALSLPVGTLRLELEDALAACPVPEEV